MDIGLSNLFSSEQALLALAAVVCAVATAAGLRLYRRDFHQLTDGETDTPVLAAVCSAGAACGLYFAGAEAEAGLLALLQSAAVCIYIIRDLRGLASRNKVELRRKAGEASDLRTQLEAYMAAFSDQAARLAEAEPAAKLLSRMHVVADNMSQGVALFDAQERLLYCNARYLAINGLSRDDVREGSSYDAILSRRLANGEASGQHLHSAPSLSRGELSLQRDEASVILREDGRAVEMACRILPGGERIATYTDVTEVRLAAAKAAQGTLSDTLTGLPSQASFLSHLDGALARMRRSSAPLAVIMLDIDHLAAVNNSLGLETGDKLLQLVAERLRELLRTTDVIARLGGDCFAVLADTLSADIDAALLAERVMDVLGVPYVIDGHHIDITTSVGVSVAPGDASDSETLLANAAVALKRAKDEGRSTCRFFETSIDTRIRARRSLEADLRSALARGELELFFQPVLDLASNRIGAFEALIRWHHAERGLLLPEAFLPFAETLGLIGPIGRWVARTACATAATWPRHLRLVLNVARGELVGRELVTSIGNALSASSISPDRLEIDVPESAVTSADAETLRVLAALREMGARIALDEFGVSHAPLTYLQAFPFDKFKIACQSGVPGRQQEPTFLLHAAATLAEGLRVETAAKRVETAEQLQAVRARRYTEAQGYLIGAPMPAQDIEAFLESFDAKALVGMSCVA
ncbi:MAG: EAL domain-containing protein [Hyphomicrobiaceae bacterium]|nr:EAL domain-containing protein [Hyphomicrobiaceae bacterium]